MFGKKDSVSALTHRFNMSQVDTRSQIAELWEALNDAADLLQYQVGVVNVLTCEVNALTPPVKKAVAKKTTEGK